MTDANLTLLILGIALLSHWVAGACGLYGLRLYVNRYYGTQTPPARKLMWWAIFLAGWSMWLHAIIYIIKHQIKLKNERKI